MDYYCLWRLPHAPIPQSPACIHAWPVPDINTILILSDFNTVSLTQVYLHSLVFSIPSSSSPNTINVMIYSSWALKVTQYFIPINNVAGFRACMHTFAHDWQSLTYLLYTLLIPQSQRFHKFKTLTHPESSGEFIIHIINITKDDKLYSLN